MVTEHLFIDFHQKLDILTKNKGKTMTFYRHNQLIWVIMSLTIVGLFQFPFIITPDKIIHGYWPFIYRFSSNMRYFDQK